MTNSLRRAAFIALGLAALAAAQDRPAALAPMPVGRHMFVAAAIDGRIYCVGGNGRGADPIAAVHAYDVATNVWSEKARWPTPSGYPCGAAVGGKLVVVGGPGRELPLVSVVERYDPVTNAWQRLADLPVARSHGVAVAMGDALYVIGGYGHEADPDTGRRGKELDGVWVLDSRTATWSAGPRLPRPAHGLAAAVVDGTIHVFGVGPGYVGTYALVGTRWEKRADAPFDAIKIPAAAVKGKVVLIGGHGASGVAVYDPAGDKWTTGRDTRVPRFLSQLVTVGDAAYALGGVGDGGRSQVAVGRYDVAADLWRE